MVYVSVEFDANTAQPYATNTGASCGKTALSSVSPRVLTKARLNPFRNDSGPPRKSTRPSIERP